MGIKGLWPLLPVRQHRDIYEGARGKALRIDTANLLFKCALKTAGDFEKGNYLPVVELFKRRVQYLKVRGVRFHVIFDGKERPEKAPEIILSKSNAPAATSSPPPTPAPCDAQPVV